MIIVEDGSIVADANSYNTVAELDAFAALRGITLPPTTAEKEVLLIQGTDYTETFWNRFQGSLVSEVQVLQFPRNSVFVNDFRVAATTIPQTLKNAQLQAAIESISTTLSPNTGQNIKKEKVDVIEVTYQDGTGSLYAPTFPSVDKYLKPLFENSGNGLITSPFR